LHGDIAQSSRERVLKRFREGKTLVLVATDVAARGIDVPELAMVINMDLPHVPEDYVHRTGRTGRAGATGQAVSLVSRDDRPLLADIEKFTGKPIERAVIAGLEPVVIEHPASARQAPKPGAHGAHRQRQRDGQRDGGQRDGGHRDGGHRDGGHRDGGQRRGGAHGQKPAQKPTHAPRPAVASGPVEEHRPAFLTRKAAAS
jgi:ATP-dependent RNA helicase RhlE